MTDKQKKFKNFYEDRKNWRPPSYTQIMKFMNWKSKNSASQAIKQYEKTKEESPIDRLLQETSR